MLQTSRFYDPKPLIISSLISQFRFQSRDMIHRGNRFSKVICESISEKQPVISCSAKHVSHNDFKSLVKTAEEGMRLSTTTKIGKELFQKVKKSHIVFCKLKRSSAIAAAALGNGKIYLHAPYFKDQILTTNPPYLFSRINIHEHVHLLHYFSDVMLSTEMKMGRIYKDFTRKGQLDSENFAHSLYSEAHAHFAERLHIYQLHKMRIFSNTEHKEFCSYIDQGKVELAFASVMYNLIKHPDYPFEVKKIGRLYQDGVQKNAKRSLSPRALELEATKEIMKRFSEI